jgi:histidyl-tRNA synthetase
LKENLIKPTTLAGFMELSPFDQLVFNKIKNTLEETYRLYGFMPLDTPVLEHSEILLAKAGGETEKQIYRFLKGDTDITMRFDLTVPLAKYVAKNYGELTFPFRRYQIGKVYRGERSQRGRFREFYQSDIDIIGDGELGLMNDAEIPSVIYKIFNKLGLDDFTIRINNRKILNGFFDMLSLTDKSADVMRTIDKIEKIGKEKVIAELCDMGIAEEIGIKITEFIAIKGSNEFVISKLKELDNGNELLGQGIEELSFVANAAKALGVPEEYFKIDLSIARGLDYYTGTVYETTFNRHPEIGSICSGGRYDNLAGFYTDKKLPGVGISIGLTRLFFILSDKEYLNRENCFGADVLVIPMNEDMEYPLNVTETLREQGIKTQIYLENKKFKAKMNYANKLEIPFVVFIGEDEIKEKQVTLKNFKTGEQTTDSVTVIGSLIKSSISNEIKPIKLA